jgi:transposase
MFCREHLTISEIKRRTSLSRNTIKKWLKEPNGAEPKYQRVKTSGKLTAYGPMLLMALEADARRPKWNRRTGLMLFEAIQKQGYTGCYSIVTDFIRRRRNGSVSVSSKSAFVPLRFELGEAFRFDWSEAEKCSCIFRIRHIRVA